MNCLLFLFFKHLIALSCPEGIHMKLRNMIDGHVMIRVLDSTWNYLILCRVYGKTSGYSYQVEVPVQNTESH